VLKDLGINKIGINPFHRCTNVTLFDEFEAKKGITIHEFIKEKNIRKNIKLKEGKIYIIGNLHHGLVKIGFSTNPDKRLSGIQCGCPFKVKVLRVFNGTMKQEKYLHYKYRNLNTNGEWFKYEGELMQNIKL